jgi:hypothetical protein
MKNYILKFIFPFAMIFISGNSYAQSWLWSQNSIGSGEGFSVATDPAGNVFVTGAYAQPTIAFGPYTLTNTNNSGNSGEIFLVKYDATGNILWARNAGGTNNDMAWNVTADANGNSYITGNFTSSSTTFGSITLTNSGTQSAFVAKYDPSGNVVWATNPTTTGTSCGYGVSVDPSGNVFVSGAFDAPSIVFGLFTLNGNGYNDCFIAKYNSSGNVQWAKSAGGANPESAQGISADMNGNAYVTGHFASSSITFGSNTITTSGQSVFLTKYDSLGNNLWAKASVGGFNAAYGNSVSADPFGNVFITGNYTDTVVFDTDSLICTGLATSSADADQEVFTVKYEAAGNVLWARGSLPLGPGGFTHNSYSVASDGAGNAYIVGGFFNPTPPPQIIFYPDTFVSTNIDALFIVKYDPFGNILCADYLTSGGDDNNGVCANAAGDVYIASDFFEANFIVGQDTLHSAMGEQVFVSKYLCGPAALDEENANGQITIFPNPSDGKFELEINNFGNGKNEIEIYNTLGEIIFQSKIQSRDIGIKSEIDLTDKPNGIYFVRIASGEKNYYAKIVKQ